MAYAQIYYSQTKLMNEMHFVRNYLKKSYKVIEWIGVILNFVRPHLKKAYKVIEWIGVILDFILVKKTKK
jgi:hypothetical protein